MKKINLREIFCFFIRVSFVSLTLRFIDGFRAPIIVSYHNPKASVLREHIEYYTKHFNFITLDELVKAINSKNIKSLPPRSIVMTFDDGHKGNYELLDLFKEFKIRPTIYVCSGLVDTTRKLWFKVAEDPQKLKKIKHNERIQYLKENYDFSVLKEFGEEYRDVLNKKELLEISKFSDIGCHTRFHPILTTMNDDEVNGEIYDAKIELEAILNKEVNHFAYPNGDFTSRELELIKKSGFKSIRTINCDNIKDKVDVFNLPVLGIDDNDSINMLVVQLSRFPKRFKNLIKTGSFSGNYSPIKL